MELNLRQRGSLLEALHALDKAHMHMHMIVVATDDKAWDGADWMRKADKIKELIAELREEL